MPRSKVLILCIFTLLAGCAKNPVTGARELHLVSSASEIKMGEQNYGFGQQMGGGIYTGDPELTAYVQEVGQKLAKVSSRSELPFEFVILNDSVPNAWAMPGGKLAINRGLLIQLNNEAELAAVLGHEITHATARHGAKAMERQVLLSGTLMAAGIVLSASDSDNKIRNEAILASAAVASNLISTKYSRSAELEADAFGMEYMVKAGYDPMAAVSLQETFVTLSEKKSSGWIEGLFASHPPSTQRANTNLLHAQKMPSDLFTGKKRYEQKLAKLRKQQPAYEEYDKALKAFKKKHYPEAHILVDDAIKTLPTEGHFYALKADILAKENQPHEALKYYDKAISLQPNYFYYYHQRGLTHEKLGQKQKAVDDFKESQKRLPSQTAQNALKRLN